jgi:ubiquinone/menaquinone biosynthesis C-methylase UbiE
MNRLHQWLCRSDRWRATMQHRVPWVLGSTDLGSNVLELGPGPGLTTDLLRISVRHLTALEIDPKLAGRLTARLGGSNVEVVEGNAAQMPFPDSAFSGAVSFTMLHHVPSRDLQDKALREVFRVLRPGGFFVGSDSLQSWSMRIIHMGDTLVLVDPDTFGTRLQAAGFEVVEIQKNAQAFRFRARRPPVGACGNGNRWVKKRITNREMEELV